MKNNILLHKIEYLWNLMNISFEVIRFFDFPFISNQEIDDMTVQIWISKGNSNRNEENKTVYLNRSSIVTEEKFSGSNIKEWKIVLE